MLVCVSSFINIEFIFTVCMTISIFKKLTLLLAHVFPYPCNIFQWFKISIIIKIELIERNFLINNIWSMSILL